MPPVSLRLFIKRTVRRLEGFDRNSSEGDYLRRYGWLAELAAVSQKCHSKYQYLIVFESVHNSLLFVAHKDQVGHGL